MSTGVVPFAGQADRRAFGMGSFFHLRRLESEPMDTLVRRKSFDFDPAIDRLAPRVQICGNFADINSIANLFWRLYDQTRSP